MPEDKELILIKKAFNVAYGSEIEVFSKSTYEMMKLSFEAGWRMSNLERHKKMQTTTTLINNH